MRKHLIYLWVLLWAARLFANPPQKIQEPIFQPTGPGTISAQEMLISGPSQIKMHCLAMIIHAGIEEPVDESYLPGFEVCAKDPSSLIREVTAQLLGQHFIEGHETPNPEAVALTVELAKDDSAKVRYNAAYYGLCNIREKDDNIIKLLVDVAISNRDLDLQERIIKSLEANRDEVIRIMDQKLSKENNVAVFEVYEIFTGKPPANAEKYLNMPSGRPRVFTFKVSGENLDAEKSELTKELRAVGISNPSIRIVKTDGNLFFAVKTHIVKDGLAVEKNFSEHPRFKITKLKLLPPEL